MFDVGFWELVLVGLVALLAFGPQELPRLVRDSLRLVRKLRNAATAASAELRRELYLDELDHAIRSDIDAPLGHIRNAIEDARQRAIQPEPESEPHPASSDHPDGAGRADDRHA